MFRRYLLLLLTGLTIRSAQAAIDFSPMIEEYSHAGFNYRKVTFKEDKGIVTYTPPQGWTIRGGGNAAQLTPPDKAFVDGVILAMPLRGPQAFDEATVAALEQQVVATAPPGSQAAQVVRRQENPVALGSNPSVEIAISYSVLGRSFERSVVFVNTVDTQLVFRFSAPKEDFGALHQRFRQSIGSWEYVETKAVAATATVAASSVESPASRAN